MRLVPGILATAALTYAERAPITCRHRMDYRGDHETAPFRSQGY